MHYCTDIRSRGQQIVRGFVRAGFYQRLQSIVGHRDTLTGGKFYTDVKVECDRTHAGKFHLKASASAPSAPSTISSKSFYTHIFTQSFQHWCFYMCASGCRKIFHYRHEGYDTEAFISVPFNLHNCHVPSVPSALLWVLEMFLKVTTSQCTLIIVMSCSWTSRPQSGRAEDSAAQHPMWPITRRNRLGSYHYVKSG